METATATTGSKQPPPSAESALPCPLQLAPFPQEPASAHPIYDRHVAQLTANAAATAAATESPENGAAESQVPQVPPEPVVIALPDDETLQQFQAELHALTETSNQRTAVVQKELKLLEAYIQEVRALDKAKAAAAVDGSATATTIKLKLNVQTPVEDASAKRKRSNSLASSDVGVGEDQSASPAGAKDATAGATKAKKKQRFLVRDGGDVFVKASSQAPLILDPVSALDGSVNKIKPSQQIPVTSFWNYVDSFFKNLSENDLKTLEEASVTDPTPYIIPPLGKPFKEQWNDEDVGTGSSMDPIGASGKKTKKKTAGGIPEDVVSLPQELLCRPLTEKLMSALIEDDRNLTSQTAASEINSEAGDTAMVPEREPSLVQSCEEMYDMEERLKRELRFIGLLPDDKFDGFADEADEISIELRRLQNDLRTLVDINNRRKRIIRERALEELAYQEYQMVVNEINRQVDQAFQRRFRASLKKKRKPLSSGNAPVIDGLNTLLERRDSLMREFEPIFPKEKFSLPKTSIFGDESQLISHVSFLTHPDPIPLPTPPPPLPASAIHTPTIETTTVMIDANGLPIAPVSEIIPPTPLTAPKPKKKKANTDGPGSVAGKTAPTASGIIQGGTESDAGSTTAPKKKKPSKPRAPRPKKEKAESDAGSVTGGTVPKPKKSKAKAGVLPGTVVEQITAEPMLIDEGHSQPQESTSFLGAAVPEWMMGGS